MQAHPDMSAWSCCVVLHVPGPFMYQIKTFCLFPKHTPYSLPMARLAALLGLSPTGATGAYGVSQLRTPFGVARGDRTWPSL
jgi:hypothetical protein